MITFARFPAGDPVPEPGNGGAVAAHVAEAFATADEARARELDRLLKTKYANTDPRRIPPGVLHQPREDEMPKGKRSEPCLKCGSVGTRHKIGCPEVSTPVTEAEKPARKRARQGNQEAIRHLADLSTDELLELRDNVDTELRDRLVKVNTERRALQEALGTDGETTPA